MPQAETPPRAWGIQRDFITFLSAPTIFTLVSNTVQAAENVAGIHSGSPAQGQNTLPPGRVTPPPLAADAAMARARRRSRTPEGRTERQSRRGHRPGHRPGKVRADAPATRGGRGTVQLEQFQFETLRVSNHTACRFAEKVQFFHSLRAVRRCAAAFAFHLFQS